MNTVESLADMTPEQLEAIEGIGPKTVEKISIAVNNYFASLDGGEAVAARKRKAPEKPPPKRQSAMRESPKRKSVRNRWQKARLKRMHWPRNRKTPEKPNRRQMAS